MRFRRVMENLLFAVFVLETVLTATVIIGICVYFRVWPWQIGTAAVHGLRQMLTK